MDKRRKFKMRIEEILKKEENEVKRKIEEIGMKMNKKIDWGGGF